MSSNGRSTASGIRDSVVLVTSVIVLVLLGIESFVDLDPAELQLITWFDTAACTVFLWDFIYQIRTAENRMRYFLRIGWLDLLSSLPFVGPLRWGRIARIARLLRLVRGLRAARVLYAQASRATAGSAIATALTATFLVLFLSSLAIVQFEKEAGTIKTAQDALWWAFVTMTTVGYGDLYPVTPAGRICAVVATVVGLATFGTFAGAIAAYLIGPSEEGDAGNREILQRLERIEALLDRLFAQAQDLQGRKRTDDEPVG